jgi:hypothetical protein
VANGKVVKSFALTGSRQKFDAQGELPIGRSGWLLLRAWNDKSDPQVLDIYPYATTSPVYLELPGGTERDSVDADYFEAWLNRTIADASARNDYRNPRERDLVLGYLCKARDHFQRLAGRQSNLRPQRC